jgi:autotransporter-associated beta strand protein
MLTLSGANTYSGDTTVLAGVLKITQDANLGTLLIEDGATYTGDQPDAPSGMAGDNGLTVTASEVTLQGSASLSLKGGRGGDVSGLGEAGKRGGNGGTLIVDGGTVDIIEAGNTAMISLLGERGGDATFTGLSGKGGTLELTGGAVMSLDAMAVVELHGVSSSNRKGSRGGQLLINNGSLILDAGSVNLYGGDGGPGLFGSPMIGGAGGDLLITNGSVTANGGSISLLGGAGSIGGIDGDNGTLDVSNGSVTVSGGSITGVGNATINAAGTFNLTDGLLRAETIDHTNGGTFSFSGGTLAVDAFLGDLVQIGGTLAAGDSPGTTVVIGDYGLLTGILDVELGGLVQGDQYDFYDVQGTVILADATLDVSLFDSFALGANQQFDFLNVAGSLVGTFNGLGEGALVNNFGGVDLFITYAGGDGNDVALFTEGLPGDFDFDNDVDGFDFLEWQRGFGSTYDSDDLADWKANYGMAVSPVVAAGTTAVPEPSSLAMLCLGGLLGLRCSRRRDVLAV